MGLVCIAAISVVTGARRFLIVGPGGSLMSEDSSPESKERLFVMRAVIALTTDSVVRKNDTVSRAESSSSN